MKRILIITDSTAQAEREAHAMRGDGDTVAVCNMNIYDHRRDYQGEEVMLHGGASSMKDALVAMGATLCATKPEARDKLKVQAKPFAKTEE